MTSTVITITANTLLDHLATGPVVSGRINRVSELVPTAAGKGVNVARILAWHGHRAIAMGFVGGDANGQLFADLVESDGIEPAFVRVAARQRIGVLAADGRSTTGILQNGFEVRAAESGALLRDLRDRLPGTALVTVGGSVPCAACDGLIRQILALCARAEVPCWVDSYGAAMDEALAGSHPPLVAKPNKQEYAGVNSKTWLACRELHVTDGANPIKVRTPEGRFRVTAPAVTEVNPIGSGDCYLAALAHGRLSGWPLRDQLAYAAAAGAANAARADVARVLPADIRELVDQVEVENVVGRSN